MGSLWHFSDVHFGPVPPGGARMQARPRGVDESTLSQDPFGALIEFARSHPADLLVVSGDFVNAAALAPRPAPPVPPPPPRRSWLRFLFAEDKPRAPDPPPEPVPDLRGKAYQIAVEFVDRLAAALGVPPERIIVCPGNHDVDRETAERDPPHSADAFYAAMARYVHPGSPAALAVLDDLGLRVLCLDTARLCHVRFSEPQLGDAPRDAPAYPLRWIDELMAGPDAARAEEAGLMGIVVAHHPPSITPTTVAELQPYDVAIGAAQAKRRLASAGYRVFFHGHKHLHVVHEERIHSGDRREPDTLLIIGSSPLLESQGSPGFNVVRFAVSKGCGDARILVQPYVLDEGGVPIPRRAPGRFAVRSRARAPAALIRIAEQINVHGDSRTRIEFHEIPLPGADTPEGGWEKDGDDWLRVFGRLIQVPYRQASVPRLFGLDSGTSPRLHGVDGAVETGTRRFRVHVAARRASGQGYASFCEESITHTAYGVSLEHQRRLWGRRPEVIPGLEPGWENLSYVMRDPADRLEISIEMPFASEGGYRARMRTYVEERPEGPLKHVSELGDFCRFHLKENSEAARLELSVEKPLVGVVYSLEWKLPREHPALSGLGREGRHRYFDALRDANRLRELALRCGGRGDRSLEPLVELHMQELLDVLREAGVVAGTSLEWCIFVPERKLWHPAGGAGVEVPHPELVPVFASFTTADARWAVSWRAGYGMAGRAYATNSVVRYVREERDSPESASGWGDEQGPETYAVVDGLTRHEVLYAIPVRHPTRVEGDVVWGVLCLGTYGAASELALDGTVSWSRLGVEGAPGDAATGVAGNMMSLAQKLLSLGLDGSGRPGVPLAGEP